MTRIDRVFKELHELHELNRAIRSSVWLTTGRPVQPDYPVKEARVVALAREPGQGTADGSGGGNPAQPQPQASQ